MRDGSRVDDEIPVLPRTAAGPARLAGNGRDGRLPDGNATEWRKARSKAGRSGCSATNASRPECAFRKQGLPPGSRRSPGRWLAAAGGFPTARSNGKTPARLLRARAQEVPGWLLAQAARP